MLGDVVLARRGLPACAAFGARLSDALLSMLLRPLTQGPRRGVGLRQSAFRPSGAVVCASPATAQAGPVPPRRLVVDIRGFVAIGDQLLRQLFALRVLRSRLLRRSDREAMIRVRALSPPASSVAA